MVLYFSRYSIAARRMSKFLAMLAAAMLVVQSASAQLRIEITEGMVAPTPIAIADFTGSNGEANDAGREIASIISVSYTHLTLPTKA